MNATEFFQQKVGEHFLTDVFHEIDSVNILVERLQIFVKEDKNHSGVAVILRSIEKIARRASKKIEQEKQTVCRALIHDLRNSFTAVIGFSQLAFRAWTEKKIENVMNFVREMRTAVISSKKIIFSAVERGVFSEFVQRFDHSLSDDKTIEEVIHIALNLSESRRVGLFTIDVDMPTKITRYETEICRVLMNIFTNAYEAMQKKKYEDTSPLLRICVQSSGNALEIAVEDNGIGMNAKTISKIFLRGFTTKKQAFGNGIGLCSVNDILQKIDGKISVESEVGIGSIFTIIIPL